MTKDELVAKISSSYAVEEGELADDVTNFLEMLLSENFIYETIN